MITERALNRAALARQLLLERSSLPVPAAVGRLLGLNAQDPHLPYLALWTRLEGFALADLTAAIEDRSVVRAPLLRATQHLVSAADFRLLRPQLAPLLRRAQRNAFGSRTRGVDLDALVAAARELLADGHVLTRSDLGRRLAERFPGSDPTALGWSVQYLLPVIHPAPSGTWGVRGPTPYASADWLGADGEPTRDGMREVVRRYLAAFGPATPADARVWSGLSGLREVFDDLRPELRVERDADGRELFDLPDAPRPAADTPAPVRFLPEFDGLLLAYHDRRRVMTDAVREVVCEVDIVAATVLVDGTVAATWSLTADRDTAALTVTPLRPLSAADRADVEAEGARLLRLAHPTSAAADVRWAAPTDTPN